MNLQLRYANLSDYKAIKSLIELSASTLVEEDYSPEQNRNVANTVVPGEATF